MGNYTIFLMFENPRRGRQARNFTENDPKILDLKSSSEQIIFRKLSLGTPEVSPLVCLFLWTIQSSPASPVQASTLPLRLYQVPSLIC